MNNDRNEIATIVALRKDMEAQTKAMQGRLSAHLRGATASLNSALNDVSAQARGDIERMVKRHHEQTLQLEKTLALVAGHRKRIYAGMAGVLLLSLLTALATWQALYGYYHVRLATLMKEVSYLESVNKADVAPCDDGRLCARVNDRGPRVGDRKQYRIVELRR